MAEEGEKNREGKPTNSIREMFTHFPQQRRVRSQGEGYPPARVVVRPMGAIFALCESPRHTRCGQAHGLCVA